MTNPEDPKHAKSVSAKQIKKTLIQAKGKAPPSLPVEIQHAAAWTQEMAGVREAARELWEAYLTQDPEIFDVAVNRVGLTPAAVRLALRLAHEARSPITPSKLGAASANRFDSVRTALLADWLAAQAKGSKKSKPQFVQDWSHRQEWPAGSAKPTLGTLERWLPKKTTKK